MDMRKMQATIFYSEEFNEVSKNKKNLLQDKCKFDYYTITLHEYGSSFVNFIL